MFWEITLIFRKKLDQIGMKNFALLPLKPVSSS